MAERAQHAWDRCWADATETVFVALEATMATGDRGRVRLKRVGPGDVMGLRARLRLRHVWPNRCWVPATLVAQVFMVDLSVEMRSL